MAQQMRLSKDSLGHFLGFSRYRADYHRSACDWQFLLHVLVDAHGVLFSLHSRSGCYVNGIRDGDCVLSSHHHTSTMEKKEDG